MYIASVIYLTYLTYTLFHFGTALYLKISKLDSVISSGKQKGLAATNRSLHNIVARPPHEPGNNRIS